MNLDPIEGRTEAERRRRRDRVVGAVEAQVRDWFTLPPSCRTKDKLISMIRISLSED